MGDTGYKSGTDEGERQSAAGEDRDLRPKGVGNFIRSVVSETHLNNHIEGVKKGYDNGQLKKP